MRGTGRVTNGANAIMGSAANAQKFRLITYKAAVAIMTNMNDPALGLLQNAQQANTRPRANH